MKRVLILFTLSGWLLAGILYLGGFEKTAVAMIWDTPQASGVGCVSDTDNNGTVDIANASRAIKAEEIASLEEQGYTWLERGGIQAVGPEIRV